MYDILVVFNKVTTTHVSNIAIEKLREGLCFSIVLQMGKVINATRSPKSNGTNINSRSLVKNKKSDFWI